MRNTIALIVFAISAICSAQKTRIISAEIVDNATKKPLEQVNIHFQGTNIGTTTDNTGIFILPYSIEKIGAHTPLEISSLGYETRILQFEELKRFSITPITIALTSTSYRLERVLVKGPQREKKTIGHTAFTAASMGYWEGQDAIGGEIASVIPIKNKQTKLLGVSFKVLQNKSDSIRVRVLFYNFRGGDPEQLIYNQPIVHTITREEGLEYINLKPYNIVVDNDVAISIQLEETYGKSIYFALSASAYGGLSFIREKSLRYWRVQKTVCVGFKVESSHPTNPKNSTAALLE